MFRAILLVKPAGSLVDVSFPPAVHAPTQRPVHVRLHETVRETVGGHRFRLAQKNIPGR